MQAGCRVGQWEKREIRNNPTVLRNGAKGLEWGRSSGKKWADFTREVKGEMRLRVGKESVGVLGGVWWSLRKLSDGMGLDVCRGSTDAVSSPLYEY